MQKQIIDIFISFTTTTQESYWYWSKPCYIRLSLVGIQLWKWGQVRILILEGTKDTIEIKQI